MSRRTRIFMISLLILAVLAFLISRVHLGSSEVTLAIGDAPIPQPVMATDGWSALQNLDFAMARTLGGQDLPGKLVDAAEALSCSRFAKADQLASPLVHSTNTRIRNTARDIVINARLALRDFAGALVVMPPYEDLTGENVTNTADSTNRLLIEAWSQAPGEQWSVPDTAVTLAIKRNLIGPASVSVRINGVPVLFAVDTGADFSVITDELAERLGIQPATEETGTSETATSKLVSVGAAVIDFVDVGSIEIKNHRCYIIDQDDLRFKLGPITLLKIEGILGWNFLQHLRTTFDFEHDRVIFEKPAAALADDGRTFFWTGVSQPLIRLYADNGTPLLLFLDTGANSTNLYKTVYQKLILEIADSKEMMVGGAGGFERQSRDLVRNVLFYCGGVELRFKEITVSTPIQELQSFARVDGVAGFDIAGGGAMVLDPTAGEFQLIPPTEAK
ncbi:MAG: aspartyl protease family protein [bacterium]